MSAGTVSAADKKVLILYADKSNGVMIAYREALQSALNDGSPDHLTFYEEYMDLWQNSSEEYLSLLRGYYAQKYRDQRFDLIITQAPSALSFISKYGEELFPGTPTVFGVLDKTRLESITLRSNITGVLEDLAFAQSVDLALRLQPGLRQVFVVSGSADSDKKYLAVAQEKFRQFDGRIEFIYLSGLSIEAMEERLATLSPDRAVILFISLYRDENGRSFTQMEAVSRISKAASVPTFSLIDRFIEAGSLGGAVISLDADAREVAKIVLRVLAGEKPENIPIQVADTNRYMFDWRQLRRWKIDEEQLPTGSILSFKQPTFWELYKWRFVAAISLFVLEALLIVGLLINRAKRLRAEKETRGFAAKVEAEHEVLQQLSGRLLTLRDEEQRRIAADLHDGLGQSLAIIKNRAQIGMRDKASHVQIMEQLQEIAATATSSIVEVRSIAHNLRPYELDRLGLAVAIESMIERISASTSIKISSNLESTQGLLSHEAETSVYRIIQEGLNNVVKHSHAESARVEIKNTLEQLIISVSDNGQGIVRSAQPANGNKVGGFGLAGIGERVRQLGGSLFIDSQPGSGTMLTIQLELQSVVTT